MVIADYKRDTLFKKSPKVFAMAGPVWHTTCWQAPIAWRQVVRGGSFNNSPENLRSANRDNDDPENRDRNNGFRCVRVPPNMPLPATPCSACQGVDARHPGLPVPVAKRPSGQATC